MVQLADLSGRVETALAGSIGPAAARAAIFDPEEAEALSRAYADLLATLRLSLLELLPRLDYHHQAREQLLKRENELLLRSSCQLLQEKLAALDRLARSVAHEIRNPVTTPSAASPNAYSPRPGPRAATPSKCLAKILAEVQELEKIVCARCGPTLTCPPPQVRPRGRTPGPQRPCQPQASRINAQFDPFLLERALKVLVDNALKAMPPGRRAAPKPQRRPGDRLHRDSRHRPGHHRRGHLPYLFATLSSAPRPRPWA